DESRFAQGQPDLHHAALKILPEDVHIRLDNHHYEAVIRDHPRAIRRDGDCFYNAVLTTLSAHSRQESRAFANNANVFREKIAQYILDHADKLDAFIDQKPNSSSALFSFPKANIAQSPLKSPHEIWYKIADYFAPTSLTKLGKVNQYLTHITSDNALWPVHLTKAEQQNFKNQRTEFIAQSQSLKKSFGQHRTLRLASQQAYVDADKKQLIEDLSRQLEETLQECRPNLFKVYCRYPALADTLLASRKKLCSSMVSLAIDSRTQQLNIIEQWIRMPRTRVSDSKLHATFTSKMPYINLDQLDHLLTNPEISHIRIDILLRGYAILDTHIKLMRDSGHGSQSQLLQQHTKQFADGEDGGTLMEWIENPAISDQFLQRFFKLLPSILYKGSPYLAPLTPYIVDYASSARMSDAKLKNMLTVCNTAPRQHVEKYLDTWATLPSTEYEYRKEKLLTHAHLISDTNLTWLLAQLKSKPSISMQRIDDALRVFTYLPTEMQAYFTGKIQRGDPLDDDLFDWICELLEKAPGLEVSTINSLIKGHTRLRPVIANSERCLDALTNGTITPEILNIWGTSPHPTKRLEAIVGGLAMDSLTEKEMDSWLYNANISTASLYALLLNQGHPAPTESTEETAWLFAPEQRDILHHWLHQKTENKALNLLWEPCEGSTLLKEIARHKLDASLVQERLAKLPLNKPKQALSLFFANSSLSYLYQNKITSAVSNSSLHHFGYEVRSHSRGSRHSPFSESKKLCPSPLPARTASRASFNWNCLSRREPKYFSETMY
ncbi:MAG: hypothetical protein IT497_09005, partial [Ottowia sp.]|nr:hypothetical protein [Ottowia sp.]